MRRFSKSYPPEDVRTKALIRLASAPANPQETNTCAYVFANPRFDEL